MKRIVGTETEFGIAARYPGSTDPVSNSIFLIGSYPNLPSSSIAWDYENENPLKDARGFEADGERERPSPEYNRLLNKLLSNGGRLYVDGAHPEYSTPECATPLELLAYEKVGERILEISLEMTRLMKTSDVDLSIYKNNTDGKGNSYGYHENYLVARSFPFEKLVSQLIPFLVTRQIFAGSGKVGSENRTEPADYQISQRADFFETLVDLNTMVKRPIINTRDEPHADPEKYRRLHVIVGDSNMSEVTTYLKIGTMGLVVAMLESGCEVDGISLDDPVRSIKEISRDLSLKHEIKLSRGVALRATDVQRVYLEKAEMHFEKSDDPITLDVLRRWRQVLDQLDDDPMQLSREIDWVIKRELIESYMSRKGCDWGDPRVSMMDLQYHNVVQKKGLYYSLEKGGYVERLISPEMLVHAQENPPTDTRAYFRGTCLKKFPKEIYAASWTSILFKARNGTIKKIPLMDPWKGGKELTGSLLEEVQSVDELLKLIAT
ncbi:MAG: depupylase/deamidase Dop [Nitrospiria bacterium]